MTELIDIVIMVVLILAIGYGLTLYDAQKKVENRVKATVFSQITPNTTNAQIVNLIHSECRSSQLPWYVFESDCENTLLKTFITPTK